MKGQDCLWVQYDFVVTFNPKCEFADNPIPYARAELKVHILKIVPSKRSARFTFKLREIVDAIHVKQTTLQRL
ncbi:hypothetical protein SAMN04489801_5935 [Pseudomonas mandelii]|uniref:Uncharacterized protein n=1 Tax=Pseudomonas mandelii TaxID=75612 RepID=A0ABY0W195_9PSED|nr:hypothetical protein SAMN04489801_5935 [Pseudomonas mandelii]